MTHKVQDVVAIAMLMEMMGVFAAIAAGKPVDGAELSNGLGPVSWPLIVFEAALYGIFTFCAIRDYAMTAQAARKAWPFLLIAAAALASTAWTIDPDATLRRAAVISGTTLIGVYFAATYSIAAFKRLIIIALLGMIAASAVAYLIHPYLVIDPTSEGSIQGLTGAKNYFGEYMALLVLLTITYDWGPKRRLIQLGVGAGAIGLLIAAHTATAILSLAAGVLILLPCFLFLRRAPRLAIPVLTLILIAWAIVGPAFSTSKNAILDAVGKDQTLTGRSQIWAIAEQSIGRHPILGYGFDSFWESKRGGMLFDDELGWAVPHSHNGYIEVLLGLGWCGMALVTLAVVRTARDALGYGWQLRDISAMWPLMFLAILLLHAISEADLVARHGLSYMILVVVSTQLALRADSATAVRRTMDSVGSRRIVEIATV
jgi:exopolysaccharide production protein ExoQ